MTAALLNHATHLSDQANAVARDSLKEAGPDRLHLICNLLDSGRIDLLSETDVKLVCCVFAVACGNFFLNE